MKKHLRKAEAAKQISAPKNRDAIRKEREEQVYDFGNAPVLLTHPAINSGEPLQGVLTGYWSTVRTQQTTFAIKEVDARLVLPSTDLLAPGKKTPTRTRPGSIFLSVSSIDVPKHLAELFPKPNTGTFDLRSRFFSAVFGAHVVFPFAYADGDYLNLEPTSLLLRSIGYVAKDGSLMASGFGTVTRGFFQGLMFGFLRSSPEPTKKPKCGALGPPPTTPGTLRRICTLDQHTTPPHIHGPSGDTWWP